MSTDDAVQPALEVELPELPERETSRLVGPQSTAADASDAGAPDLRPQARRCRPCWVCTFAVVGGAVLAAIATALLSPYLPRWDDVPGLLDVAAARGGVLAVRMPAADVETDAYSCAAFEWQDAVVSVTASLPAPSDVRGVHHMSLFRCGALAAEVEVGQRFPCDDVEGLCRSEPQMLFGFEHMEGGDGGASAAPEQLELPIAIQVGRSIHGARYMLVQTHYNRPLARDDSGFQLTVQAAVGIEGQTADAAQNTPASDESNASASSTSSTSSSSSTKSASSPSSPSSSSSSSSSASSASAPARLFHVELGAADFGADSIPPGETASVVGPYRFTIPEATHCFLFLVHLHYHSLGRLASFRLLPKRWEKGVAFPHEYEEVRVERRTTVVGVGGGGGGGGGAAGAGAAGAAAVQIGTTTNTIAATARRAGAGDEGALLPLPIATFGQRTGRTLQFKTPIELHGGDVIEFSCTFDSSTTSGTKQTAFGMKSTNEMCQVFLLGYIRGEGGMLRWDGGNAV